MKKTKFNQEIWNIKNFNEIGYVKEQQKLFVFFINGEILEFHQVEEKHVFELVTSSKKDELIDQNFKQLFPYIQHSNSMSITV